MKKIVFSLLIFLLLLQLIPLDKTNPPIEENNTLTKDASVMKILKKSSYDCHSNETI
ncbi:MAG: heme-binding domain-containing protein [Sulfurimonadaceae bacterium]|jgi:hypothetical protein|nr:heme-binding domain-containing protein [Sulfurimonadaceae bacterium]